MERTIPKFMVEKREIFRFMCFVLFFVIIFSLIYHPNVAIRGLDINQKHYVYYLFLMITSGFIMLAASRFIFYKLNKKEKRSFNFFCWWIIQEIILISLTLSIVALNLNEPNTRPYFSVILPRTTIAVFSLLIIPYVICWLYFSLEEKNFLINEIINKRKLQLSKGVINFSDEKGVFRISVRIEDLLYIQSADNYIFIYYQNKSGLTKFMLRNSLKYIEENFTNMNLVRCHRFYIVNLKKVRVLRKEKEGLILELDNDIHTEIPVSKTYTKSIADLFTQE